MSIRETVDPATSVVPTIAPTPPTTTVFGPNQALTHPPASSPSWAARGAHQRHVLPGWASHVLLGAGGANTLGVSAWLLFTGAGLWGLPLAWTTFALTRGLARAGDPFSVRTWQRVPVPGLALLGGLLGSILIAVLAGLGAPAAVVLVVLLAVQLCDTLAGHGGLPDPPLGRFLDGSAVGLVVGAAVAAVVLGRGGSAGFTLGVLAILRLLLVGATLSVLVRSRVLFGGGDVAQNLDGPTSDAPLSDASLSGAPLSDAPLSDASLSDAPLSDAPLSHAPLSHAPWGLRWAWGLHPRRVMDVLGHQVSWLAGAMALLAGALVTTAPLLSWQVSAGSKVTWALLSAALLVAPGCVGFAVGNLARRELVRARLLAADTSLRWCLVVPGVVLWLAAPVLGWPGTLVVVALAGCGLSAWPVLGMLRVSESPTVERVQVLYAFRTVAVRR